MASNDVNNFRRTWDRDQFERKAQERMGNKKKNESDDDEDEVEEKSKEPPKKKVDLKARDYKVDLESRIGKTVVISKAATSAQAGGFFCEICDCVVKDSINYLDHINGKKHQRNLGMNMRVKRSTLDDVKARFELKLKQREETKKSFDMEERVKELAEEEEKAKAYRREKKKRKKEKRREEEDETIDGDGDQMSSFMGFSSFGSKKPKK